MGGGDPLRLSCKLTGEEVMPGMELPLSYGSQVNRTRPHPLLSFSTNFFTSTLPGYFHLEEAYPCLPTFQAGVPGITLLRRSSTCPQALQLDAFTGLPLYLSGKAVLGGWLGRYAVAGTGQHRLYPFSTAPQSYPGISRYPSVLHPRLYQFCHSPRCRFCQSDRSKTPRAAGAGGHGVHFNSAVPPVPVPGTFLHGFGQELVLAVGRQEKDVIFFGTRVFAESLRQPELIDLPLPCIRWRQCRRIGWYSRAMCASMPTWRPGRSAARSGCR